jgi:hypothetical protein
MLAGRQWQRVGVLLALVTIAVAQSPKYKKADPVPLYANKVRLPSLSSFFATLEFASMFRYTGSATRARAPVCERLVGVRARDSREERACTRSVCTCFFHLHRQARPGSVR